MRQTQLNEIFDIAILGAGPAGMAAATVTASRGARKVLLEESPAPGGQLYRAMPPGFTAKPDTDLRAGDGLRAALLASGATLRLGCRVWAVGGGSLVPATEAARAFRAAHGEVLAAIRDLKRDGMTMLIVSHEMGFVREVADEVVFMDRGAVVEHGPPDRLLDAPDTARLRDFTARILRHG